MDAHSRVAIALPPTPASQPIGSRLDIPLAEIGLLAESLRTYLLLAAICCVPVLLFLPFMATPFMRDEAFYATVAQAMRHYGAMPYAYGFDNKPPMIFYWYYFSFGLFGENVWAPRLMAALLLSFSCILMYVQARVMFSQGWGLVAALFFGLSMGIGKFEIDANTEYFLIPFMLLALVSFTLGQNHGEWYWHALCGAACAVSIMTKQTAVFCPLVFVAFALYPLAKRRSLRGCSEVWRGLALMCAGGAAGLAVVLLPFAVTGNLGEFYRGAVVYAQQYSAGLTLSPDISLASLQQLITAVPWALLGEFSRSAVFPTAPVPLTLYHDISLIFGLAALQPLLAAGPWTFLSAIGALRILRRPSQWNVLLVFWLLAAGAGIVVAGRFYSHYFVILLPMLALLSVPAFQWLKANWWRSKAGFFILALVPLVSIWPVITNASIYLQPTLVDRHLAEYPGNPMAVWESQSEDVGHWIASITRPGEKIYEFGFMPGVYFYSGRQSPTQYIFKHPFAIDESYARDAVSQMDTDKPVLILDSAAYETDGEFAYHGKTMLRFMQDNYLEMGKYYFGDLWVLKGWQPAKPIDEALHSPSEITLPQ